MVNTIKVILVGNVIARGTLFGFANEQRRKARGRIIHDDNMPLIKDKFNLHKHLILVCNRITEDMIPALRVVDGVVAESGSDIPPEQLALINSDLVWILNVPDAHRILENDLSVTLDSEQGVVYEGIV